MKQLRIIFFIIINANILICQSEWKVGYLVTNNNDTLSGQINLTSYSKMGEQCTFRSNSNSQSKTFLPKDIKSYSIKDVAFYVSKKIDDTQTVFLEYLVNGKLDLFYIRKNDDDRYFIETDTLPLKELIYNEGIRNVNGVNYQYETKTHLGLLAFYTRDAPELYSRIGKIKPDFKALKRITVDYHNIVCKDESCITYRNREPYTKVAIGPHIGRTSHSYYNGNTLINENYLSYGFYVRAWSPRMGNNLFLKTGAIFSKFDEYNHSIDVPTRKKTIAKIPLQIEYVIPTSFIFKPKASFGIDFYTNSAAYIGASIGSDFVIGKNINMSLIYDREIYEIVGLRNGSKIFDNLLIGMYYML